MKPLVCGSTFILLARQGKDGRNKRFQLAMATRSHYAMPAGSACSRIVFHPSLQAVRFLVVRHHDLMTCRIASRNDTARITLDDYVNGCAPRFSAKGEH
jgi:hypothetical protein